ncbi:MAG: rhomboid family intramembrane serine protease [Muribaculaceae bacterium]|nr:rhomboid family intramembrane serine protease [Muribaculaceae bacterium]
MQYNNRSFWSSIMPVTKHLLVINIIVWLATMAFQRAGIIDLQRFLGLHFWKGSDFNPAQLLTYMFMHDTRGFAHIFFNMFSLWMFGSLLERVLGSKRYLFYYISCGLGAALVQELVWQFTWQDILRSFVTVPTLSVDEIINAINAGQADFTMNQFYNSLLTVGASGAVFGILLAFGMIFPNMPMYIIPFPFPIKAKWMVLGYGLIELFFGISGAMSGVAHFAHLGGMIAGIIMILYWKRNGTLMRGNGFY